MINMSLVKRPCVLNNGWVWIRSHPAAAPTHLHAVERDVPVEIDTGIARCVGQLVQGVQQRCFRRSQSARFPPRTRNPTPIDVVEHQVDRRRCRERVDRRRVAGLELLQMPPVVRFAACRSPVVSDFLPKMNAFSSARPVIEHLALAIVLQHIPGPHLCLCQSLRLLVGSLGKIWQ